MSLPEQMKTAEFSLHIQPSFDPSEWHACEGHVWESCLQTANCYAYALNRPDYHWAIPGHGFVQAEPLHVFYGYHNLFQNLTYAEHREYLIDGARQDGLIATTEPQRVAGYYSVALFFSDREDYGFHWYRQDSGGTWSHKNGWRPVSNHDSEGRVILDPRQDERSGYSILGGFFLAPLAGIQLQHNFRLLAQNNPN